MIFEQIYLGCLSQASYLIADGGDAVIVDPRRDVEVYLRAAQERGLSIRHVVLTHLHADFVSGHRELQERTGAEIVLGEQAGASFPHRAVKDGDELRLGGLVLRFWETPGHTPESVTVLVIDPAQSPEPCLAFTGDTLFIGDVGRPDLVAPQGQTPEAMAERLYDSLHEKILPLQDDVEIWPGHGAGSSCGKNISSERTSTLGAQRVANPMLRPMARAQFVELATAGLGAPPRYFAHDAAYNRRGAPGLDEIGEPLALSVEDFRRTVQRDALVLDVRDREAFGRGHVPGALNVGLDGNFASWVGALVPAERTLALVAADGTAAGEARMRLARVGIENVAGFLAGGVDAWRASESEVAALEQITPQELERRLAADETTVLDVRGPGEYAGAHVPNAVSIPLPELPERVAELDLERPIAVVCQSGFRSSAAASLLAARGARNLVNVRGGTKAWIDAGLATERGVVQPAT